MSFLPATLLPLLLGAGQTDAASASQSTAASQQDDEEEVAEVDELAFQNLKNYDENPQGIVLPADQSLAYDDDGNGFVDIIWQSTSTGAASYYQMDATGATVTSLGNFGLDWEIVGTGDGRLVKISCGRLH